MYRVINIIITDSNLPNATMLMPILRLGVKLPLFQFLTLPCCRSRGCTSSSVGLAPPSPPRSSSLRESGLVLNRDNPTSFDFHALCCLCCSTPYAVCVAARPMLSVLQHAPPPRSFFSTLCRRSCHLCPRPAYNMQVGPSSLGLGLIHPWPSSGM